MTTADKDHYPSAAMYARLSAVVRLVASMAALHISFLFNPLRNPSMTAPLALLSLLFTTYAVWRYWLAVRNNANLESHGFYWVDALSYLTITVLTGGPRSQFFFFLSFPLLFMSLHGGFRPAIVMSLFLSGALWVSGILISGTSAMLFNADILLPPLGLLLLGYLMAVWANVDRTVNRQMSSLQAFNALFSPRFNFEQMMDRVVRHLATMRPVEKFALVLLDADRPPVVFRADLPDAMYQVSDAMSLDIGNVVAGLEAKGTVIYTAERGLVPAQIYSSDADAASQAAQIAHAGLIANRFDCQGFSAITFSRRNSGSARLFVWGNESNFVASDLPFFLKLAEQIAPWLENMQMLDRLAGEVADAERQKISRDIHDSAIQPYIGLKFGLEALARKVPPENPVSNDIGRLVEMVTTEITELRTFVKGLRGDDDPGRAALLPALRRQAKRFGELYGIDVTVESPPNLHIGDALANEAFHIVSEALSNIRRHSVASTAKVTLSCDADTFTLRVSNPCSHGGTGKLFTPVSIVERAHALGGECQVETRSGGSTDVTVEIPLRGPERQA